MPSQTRSPNMATSTYQDDFGAPWNDVSNALVVDGSTATSVDAGGGEGTDDILLEDYHFDIPAGATITGVVAEPVAQANTTGGYFIELWDSAGGPLGDAKTGVGFPDTDLLPFPIGSSSDLWGAKLNPDAVNASTFGVRFRANVGNASDVGSLDGIPLTVHYTEATAGGMRSRDWRSRPGR